MKVISTHSSKVQVGRDGSPWVMEQHFRVLQSAAAFWQIRVCDEEHNFTQLDTSVIIFVQGKHQLLIQKLHETVISLISLFKP